MKCQICGAKLSKDGQICNNCLNKLKEEKITKNDSNLRFTLRKRFNLLFQSGYYFEALVILIIMIIASSRLGVMSVAIVFSVFMFGIFFVRMFFKKKSIDSYKCCFYDTKLEYQYDFLFKKESKTIKYKDIKEIAFYQTIWERMFNLGRIVISTNSGNFLNNGIEIDSIYNVEEVCSKIKEVTGA